MPVWLFCVYVSFGQVFGIQGAGGVEHGNDHHAHICKDGCPHSGNAQCTQQQAQCLDAQRKHDVLVHDAQGAAGDAHSQRDFGGVVIHQHHVCGLDGGVRTQRTHGDAHVCAGKHRRIVDAVTHKGKVLLGLLFSQQLFDLVYLVAGQKTGVVLVQTQLLPPPVPPAAHRRSA